MLEADRSHDSNNVEKDLTNSFDVSEIPQEKNGMANFSYLHTYDIVGEADSNDGEHASVHESVAESVEEVPLSSHLDRATSVDYSEKQNPIALSSTSAPGYHQLEHTNEVKISNLPKKVVKVHSRTMYGYVACDPSTVLF